MPKRITFIRYISWAFFCFHLALFIGINSFLIVTNMLNNPNEPWFIIPLSSWAIFLLLHFLAIFIVDSRSARDWRSIQIRKDALDKLNLGLTNEEMFKKTTSIFFAWTVFYFHLAVFVGGSIIMGIINYFVTPENKWSIIPIVAWAIWTATHYVITYIVTSEKLLDWRSKKIASFVYRDYTLENKKEVFKEAMLFFGFWISIRAHITLYLLSNALMIASDFLFNTTGQHWYYYPLISWGIFLLAHGLLTFLIISPRLAKWRHDKINSLN